MTRTLQLAAALLALQLACGGGGGGGSAPAAPSAPPAPPTITGLAPSSAVRGATVTITGTAFTGATAVSFHGTAATFTVQSATQIKATVPTAATNGIVSVTTPGGTATSSTSFTVAPSPLPTLTGLAPAAGPVGTMVTLTGTGFTGATGVSFNGQAGTFAVVSDAQITATVPSGATTGAVTVTTPGGTSGGQTFTLMASATLDLTVDGFYLTQSSQTYPATVSLVKDRSAWLRVFVKANEANSAQPQVKATFTNGATVNTLTLNAPGLSVPTSINEGDATQSWNIAVPAAWIQPGLQVSVQIDPSNLIPEASKANNTASATPTVENLKVWKIRLLPVTTGDGRTGAVDASSAASFVDMAKRIHPVPDAVDVAVGPSVTSSATLLSDGTGWDTVLSDLTAKWNADGHSAYYYGVVNPNYGGGVAGEGWVGQAAAIGWDKAGSRAGVLAHEVGHNFGRPHSPCGGAGNPDPSYPTTGNYAGGHIGVTGWDAFAGSNNLKAAATYTDIMGYCSTQWVSDYVYTRVLSFRKASAIGLAPTGDPAAPAVDGLLVWGTIRNGVVSLNPAVPVHAPANLPEPGAYRWEARDAAGTVRLSVPFHPSDLADGPEAIQGFAFVVPLGSVAAETLFSTHLFAGDAERHRAVRLAPSSASEPLRETPAVNALNDLAGVNLTWDEGRHPLVVARDAVSGEILGFLRGGRGRLVTDRKEVELLACDGVQVQIQRHLRP